MYVQKQVFLLFVILLFLSPSSYAQLRTELKATPAGELALSIAPSESPEFIREWLSTPPEQSVIISRLNSVKPNQLIITALFVTGLTADNSGSYKYSVDVHILSPNNELLWGQGAYASGKGLLPQRPVIMIADPALDLIFESSAPQGTYRIVGRVLDHVSGKTAEYSYSLDLKIRKR